MMKRVSTLPIIFLFIITACTTEEKIVKVRAKYSGDHTTAQIRGMWVICYNTRIKNMPYMPPPMHMDHCDCVIDKSREKYSSSDYKGIGTDNLTRFFTETSITCDDSTIAQPEPTSI
jgi:hypothetical protein